MVEYKTRDGRTLFKPEIDKDISMEDMDDDVGWCLSCGETVSGVEPDARKYRCECCEKNTVYGLVELCLMNLVA